MDGSQQHGEDEPAAPHEDLDAERHVARLTGMTPEAARAFVYFHRGLPPGAPTGRRAA